MHSIKTLLALAACATLAWATTATSAAAHGAVYQPPPIVEVPPNKTKPDPAPGGPVLGGGADPGGGAAPATPLGPPAAGKAPATGGAAGPGTVLGAEQFDWAFWWEFHREELLDLKGRLLSRPSATGEGTDTLRPGEALLDELVVPKLLEALAKARADGVAGAVLIALARIGSPRTEEIAAAIHGALSERDPEAREAAVLALGILGRSEDLELLVRLLSADSDLGRELGRKVDDRMRSIAAYALGILGARATMDDVRRTIVLHLLPLLEDQREERDLRVAATIALGGLGTSWEREPPPASETSSSRSRAALVQRVLALREEEADDFVRAHMASALGELIGSNTGAPEDLRAEVLAALVSDLGRKLPTLEQSAVASALGRAGSGSGAPIDVLVRETLRTEASSGKDAHARHMAVIALGEASARSLGVASTGEARDAFVAALADLYREGRSTDRAWYAIAAGVHAAGLQRDGLSAPPPLIELLRARLVTGSGDEVAATALALGLSGDADSGPLLARELAQRGNPQVQGFLALAIGLVGHRESTDEVLGLMSGMSNQAARLENAAAGAALLDRGLASERLQTILSHALTLEVAASAARVLGSISDPAAVPLLVDLLADKQSQALVRAFSAVALGLVGDRTLLSWRVELTGDLHYAALTATLYDAVGRGVLNIL